MEKQHFYREARHDLAGPLSGIRVADLTTTWAGPMCACVLADFGADVIKIELPEGEVARRLPPLLPNGQSFAYATANRNKRSLTLDVRSGEGRETLRKLVAGVDVFVENFRPGTLAAWGLGYDDLLRVKPDLVYVSISGFGQFGPGHDAACYDALAQAASGFMSLNGEPEGAPVKAPTFLGDDLAGLHGALGALAALHHRARTGEGQHVDVALLDALLFQSDGLLTLGALDIPFPRTGNEYPFASPANAYPCRDGHVYLGVLLDNHWQRFARAIDRPDLADDPKLATGPGRVAAREEINRAVAAWCAERTASEVLGCLGKERLSAVPIRSYAETARDPLVLERDMLQEATGRDGTPVPITGPAVKFSRTPTRVRQAAPELGADDDAILAGLGLGPAEIRMLREKGVVRTPGGA